MRFKFLASRAGSKKAGDRIAMPAVLKPPCPQCGAQTFSIWTWTVGLAWLLFFPAGAAMLLWRPTYRCWSCGCKFKSGRASEALATVPVSHR
jgi:hypothetical protein